LAAAREYELVLMLDPGQDEPAREALAQDARGRIEGAGTLKQENTWGLRKMAYEIEGRNEADYRWLRFEGPSELLDDLNHNLKIAGGVLRFRIFKVDPDSPSMVPPTVAAPTHSPSRERGDRGPQGPRDDAEAVTAVDDAEAETPAAVDAVDEPAAPAPPAAE
jgi:small subunit ribosomal protein S6